MTDTTPAGHELFSALTTSWLETTTLFWRNLATLTSNGQEAQPEAAAADPTNDGDPPRDSQYRTYRSWETTVDTLGTLLGLLSSPENHETLLKSIGNCTETLAQATGDSLENLSDFHGQLIGTLAKMGEYTTAYNLDDIDHAAFEAARELYRKEIQKYLRIPKIGLPRELHEQLSQLIDRSTLFSSHPGELIYLFLLPLEQSNQAMQQKTKAMLERGEFIEDVKQGYNEWIKTLEDRYMELLKSPEYTEVLDNTITSLAAYKEIKLSLTDHFLKDLRLPTTSDMDQVYRDLYLLKKNVKQLTRQVAELQSRLEERPATWNEAPCEARP